jgi:IS30 family transposase
MKYKHLTQEQRYHIGAYKAAGLSQKAIAQKVEVHPATISRELKRNAGKRSGIYFAGGAHAMAVQRQQAKSKAANLKLTAECILLVKHYLKQEFSPEQIAATLHLEHGITISHVPLYSYIHHDRLQGGALYTHLRHRGKRRAKYGSRRKNRIPNRVSIDQRPAIVEARERIGDFEIDTIIGKGRRGAIVTMVDRASLYVQISLPVSKRSQIVSNEIIRKLAPVRKHLHTITTDNGLEFANHQEVSRKLKCDHYFCHPYSSWERGTNENINGLIRQYIPKGSSFENLTEKEISFIENRLNHRPRKSLGWRTPHEVFFEKLKAS